MGKVVLGVGLHEFCRQNFEQNKRFLGEHSAGRIRHFRAKFEQHNGKSVTLMICITLVRNIEIYICWLRYNTDIMKKYGDLALHNELGVRPRLPASTFRKMQSKLSLALRPLS